jgi:glycosyltransferase involved in cell wall biosynthesis
MLWGSAPVRVEEPVRVVRVQSRICVGGPALHTILLTEGLSPKRGSRYETTLVGGALEPGEASMEPFAKDRAVEVRTVHEMRRPVSPKSDAIALAKMVQLFRRVRPVIVHTHTAKAGAIGRVAARIAGVPIVVHTFHGHVFDGYFSRAGSAAIVAAERALTRLTDRVLAISPAQRHELTEKYRIAPQEKVVVVPLGLELDRFRAIEPTRRGPLRTELGIGEDVPVVVTAGRIVPIKRFDVLIRAFAKVLESVPNAILLIAGDGDAAHRAPLVDLARSISGRIRFLGWRKDLDRLYGEADAFALSSDNEGTPVAVIEALSAGLPVVATDVGGLSDILAPGMGHLVTREDDAAIARALIAILQSGGRVDQMLRDRIVGAFSHRRLISDVTHVYDSLLDDFAARSALQGERPRFKREQAC